MSSQDSIIRESIQTKASLGETESSDIDSIINKWLNLQKILKESQSLEKIIEKQHFDNYTKMKQYIQDFYKLKIKSRKLYEDIKYLKMNSEGIDIVDKKDKNFYVTEASGTYFRMALTKIENLFSIIREYYDYIPKIVSLIDEKDSKQEIESLAEFFCNQFYTNIFIPNPEKEELLICTYKLLEQEINKMDIADLDNFLNDSTFMGKFMTAFSKQQDLNNFLVNLVNKVISEVDKRNTFLLDLSLNKMMKEIKKEKDNVKEFDSRMTETFYSKSFEKDERFKGIKPIELILEKIPKTKINFKKHLELEDEIFRESQSSSNESSSLYNEDINFVFEGNSKFERKSSEYNTYYFKDLNKKFLSQKLKEFSDPDLLSFYRYLINQLSDIYHDENAFANSYLFLLLKRNYFFYEKHIVAKIYLLNFLFIQEQVEDIIQSLIDKIATIPYSVRCVCTIIDILIKKKFPKLQKFLRHSFIGKFLFNKCIFPILNLENTNALKTKIFTKAQINCLKCIVSILSKANQCKLFDVYNDVEKTMFNYYLLEIIPLLNNFYDKLVDMRLPGQLNEFINDSIKKENKNIFLFNSDNTENNINKNIENKKQNYEYFKENLDELIRIKSICFNEQDILFILRLIQKDVDKFKDLPEFNRFRLTMKEEEMDEDELGRIIEEEKCKRAEAKKKEGKNTIKDSEGEGYYTFIYKEQNSQFNYKLKEFYKEDKKKKEKKEKSLLSRMKNSIKTILRRLNLLNVKEYSFLNFATSNEKFFQAIHCTLKDFDEDDNLVPLNWHSKFIINNKNQLEPDYLKNDFEKLYEEIFLEEKDFLNKLKSLSPIINAREMMNLNCAENAIENMKFLKNSLQKTKELEKVKIFIALDKTEVCINLVDVSARTFNKEKLPKNENMQFIKVVSVKHCIHRSDTFLYTFQGQRKKKIKSHVKNVNEFINKLIRPNYIIHETILKYIKEDIETGQAKHQISMLFIQYKEQLKQSLIKNFKELIEDKNDPEEIMENVEEYILRKIYSYVFPPNPLTDDITFYKLTNSYDWMTATDFSVKDNIPLEAIQDSISYLLQMEERARSISEKLRCIKMVYNNISRIQEFYFDKVDKSADGITPILNYIIVKTHPKRFISNINYLNCFTEGRDLKDIGVYIKTCESSIQFVWDVNPTIVNLTAEEFNKRCSIAGKKLDNL